MHSSVRAFFTRFLCHFLLGRIALLSVLVLYACDGTAISFFFFIFLSYAFASAFSCSCMPSLGARICSPFALSAKSTATVPWMDKKGTTRRDNQRTNNGERTKKGSEPNQKVVCVPRVAVVLIYTFI